MANQETGGYCKHCDKKVMLQRSGTNHILHVILSVLTAGIWIPIWILTSIKVGGWRCKECGSSASAGSDGLNTNMGGIIVLLAIILFAMWLVFKDVQ